GVLGRGLEEKSVGIGFESDQPVLITHFVFVMGSFADSRNKNLPNTRGPERAHLVNTAVPVIEITDDADAMGIGSPHCEARTRDAVDSSQLGTELFIDPPLVPFSKQVEIGFTQCWQERIGIACAPNVA